MSRPHCTGSSPVELNIKEKNSLKKSLKKLDSKLSRMKEFTSKIVIWIHPEHTSGLFYRTLHKEEWKKLQELDLKRKEVRNKLKGYY